MSEANNNCLSARDDIRTAGNVLHI